MSRERRSISKDFRRQVVKLAQQPGASLEWIAKDLGISVFLLERWLRAATTTFAIPGDKDGASSSQDFEEVRRN